MDKYPNYQDRVKHKYVDASGVVIAKYEKHDETYFDVRSDNDRIWYGTMAKNWETIQTEEEAL